MTFALANFAPIGNSSKPLSGVGSATIKGAPSLFSYVTADVKNTVSASGYFNSVVSLLPVGTLIYCVTGAGSGGTMVPSLLVVVSNTGSVVDTADGTNVSTTDTY